MIEHQHHAASHRHNQPWVWIFLQEHMKHLYLSKLFTLYHVETWPCEKFPAEDPAETGYLQDLLAALAARDELAATASRPRCVWKPTSARSGLALLGFASFSSSGLSRKCTSKCTSASHATSNTYYYTNRFTCVCVCTYIRTYLRTMYVCMHACMYACMHACKHVSIMYVCLYVCTYVCTYVRMYVCM
jgi:hypothetical protein